MYGADVGGRQCLEWFNGGNISRKDTRRRRRRRRDSGREPKQEDTESNPGGVQAGRPVEPEAEAAISMVFYIKADRGQSSQLHVGNNTGSLPFFMTSSIARTTGSLLDV
ncbi:unnamed protein product [Pleuronectes platessa]|uniref:Uncharacterized protein n=1 Tax=Pleuronectes platessa TaxID=8262 RepID=A0A9N7YGX5_PLEPL|nr:unnamed protein product [Pleuronectes platessa]